MLIFIDMLVCGIIFSAADKFAPSALKRVSTVLALTLC